MTDKKSIFKGLFKQIMLLIPPPPLKIPFLLIIGAFAGLSFATFLLTNTMSYMSDDPKACINCHIMRPEYSTWYHGSHRERASCNDCHVPHDSFYRKYYFKASDGLRHAFMFTFHLEPQVIRIHDAGKGAVQENCIRCHINQVSPVSSAGITLESYKHGEGKLCWECHRETPHGRVHSLASTPNSLVPVLESPLPKWMTKFIEEK
jgi:cytochrome c nitrite reductase small subunit